MAVDPALVLLTFSPIPKSFTKMAAFGMRLEIEELNHLGRRKLRHRALKNNSCAPKSRQTLSKPAGRPG